MKRLFIFSFIIFSILLTACVFGATYERVDQVESRTYPVTSFTQIDCGLPVRVYVTQGPEYSVTAETHYVGFFDDIEVKVSSGRLKMRYKGKGRFCEVRLRKRDNYAAEFHVTLPTVEGLTITGSGDIVCSSTLNSPKLNLSVTGSGDMRLASVVVEQNVKVSVTGSGDIRVSDLTAGATLKSEITGSGDIGFGNVKCTSGSFSITGSGDIECGKYVATKDYYVEITGSGDVDLGKGGSAESGKISVLSSGTVNACGVVTKHAATLITGSGDAYVYVNETLKCSIRGSGTVKYWGDAKVEVASMSGSGSLRRGK